MSTAPQQHDAGTYEQLIFQVRGIQAARVVTAPNGAIDEVHVVGLPGRSAKQMVRDIESILYVRGGVRLDHRKVSLVQLDEGAQRFGPRVRLLEVVRALDAPVPAITVTLGLRDRRASGVATAVEGVAPAGLELAGRATVNALVELIGPGSELRIEQLGCQPFGTIEVCLCQLSLTSEAEIEMLLGVSMVREDGPAAAARAVLDAVNRPLLRLLSAQV
ncbi:MAG TPA: hypothetical protein PKD53_11855 [Chloroflexaceae bacterium]|nr:hypothetical protein [Chloroflexaceae bacterium]